MIKTNHYNLDSIWRASAGFCSFLGSKLRKSSVLLVFLIVLFVPIEGDDTDAATQRPVVQDVKLGVHPNKTRFVMNISQETGYKVFMLKNPYRVVIDFPALEWKAADTVREKGMIKGYRYGLFNENITRIVLEVDRPVLVENAFFVKEESAQKGKRFVVDVTAVSADQFTKNEKKIIQQGQIQAVEVPELHETSKVATAQQKPSTVSEPEFLNKAELEKPKQVLVPTAPAPASKLKPIAPQENAPPLIKVEEPMIQQTEQIGSIHKAPQSAPLSKGHTSGKKTIVIDAGHGGVDPGAIGVDRSYEKNITLAVAKELKKQILKTGKYNVVLTRETDVFIPLKQRVAIARKAKADLFVSLHADSVGKKSTRGASVYTLSEKASDKEAELLASRENKADVIAGMDLSTENEEVAGILIDLAQRDTMNQSRQFASHVVKTVGKESLLLTKPNRSAGFAVLKAPDIPSVLIEMGYLSNPTDCKLLKTSSHQQKLSKLIASSVDAFFNGGHSSQQAGLFSSQ
jgi:N-acetylmuramoyl-L-alanine amidase